MTWNDGFWPKLRLSGCCLLKMVRGVANFTHCFHHKITKIWFLIEICCWHLQAGLPKKEQHFFIQRKIAILLLSQLLSYSSRQFQISLLKSTIQPFPTISLRTCSKIDGQKYSFVLSIKNFCKSESKLFWVGEIFLSFFLTSAFVGSWFFVFLLDKPTETKC